MIKKILKRVLLRKKNIFLDFKSEINYNVEVVSDSNPIVVNDSCLHITKIGEGCSFEHAFVYGDVEIGNYVSISGPGTVIHSEVGKIKIGSFSSIAPNVCIVEFNHDMERNTTYAINYNVYGKSIKEDVVSKGDVIIGEDVWIGANVVITSGVKIGRGAVIAANSVVTKDVESYSVVGGNPAHLIKKRFERDKIDYLEKTQWWLWKKRDILNNKDFFE